MPVFGKLFQQIALSRFTRNLGTMMHSGVPILQSLDIVADTTGNVVVGRVVRDVQDSVRTGEALTAPLSKHPVIPAMVVQMMTVGEETGALDTMLHKISEFYDQEVEATTESLTALDRAADDRVPRRHHRIDDRGALHADLQDLHAHQLTRSRRTCGECRTHLTCPDHSSPASGASITRSVIEPSTTKAHPL